MPPPISEDEASDSDVEEVEVPAEKPSKKSRKEVDEPTEAGGEDVGGEEDDAEEEDDEAGEDEFVVEAIKSHLVNDDKIMYYVKWEGYEKRSDMTWEPEENLLGSAEEILNTYLESVGGREAILGDHTKKKESKTKKRGRAATSTKDSKPNGKKARTNSQHPASTTPPASLKNAEFVPPTGSWEDAVRCIDACEGDEGDVIVFLQWTNGRKTQHPLEQVYKRCPQKMLKFYESHLVFKKSPGKEPATEEA